MGQGLSTTKRVAVWLLVCGVEKNFATCDPHKVWQAGAGAHQGIAGGRGLSSLMAVCHPPPPMAQGPFDLVSAALVSEPHQQVLLPFQSHARHRIPN